MEERKDVLVGKKKKKRYSLPFVALQQDATNGNNKGIEEVLQQGIENKEER